MTETYLVEETKELIHDETKLKEWKEHVEELGLKGQKSLSKKEKSPVPFQWMNRQLTRSLHVICGTEVKVKDYNKSPIPLEILGLIKLSEMEKYFPEGIFILYDEEKTDPICIGKVKKDIDTEEYLIGRWGDENRPLDELQKIAYETLVKKRKDQITDSIAKLNGALNSIEYDCRRHFSDNYSSVPSSVSVYL